MMLHYYRLNPDKSTERLSADDWVLAFSGDLHVASERIGDVNVSTVFLGLDHSHGYGPPLLFETMIFGGEHDLYQERCSTYEQALDMHSKAVEKVKAAYDETRHALQEIRRTHRKTLDGLEIAYLTNLGR